MVEELLLLDHHVHETERSHGHDDSENHITGGGHIAGRGAQPGSHRISDSGRVGHGSSEKTRQKGDPLFHFFSFVQMYARWYLSRYGRGAIHHFHGKIDPIANPTRPPKNNVRTTINNPI